MRQAVIPLLVLVTALAGSARAQDLRDRYGTRSLEAAKAIDDGIRLVEEKKCDAALERLKRASELDPDCHMAYAWLANAHTDLGDIDLALAEYERLYRVALRTRTSDVLVDGCINAGLLLGKLGREPEALPWFSRAIVGDPTDQFQLRWKAYRNMAVGLRAKHRPLSAAISAIEARQANPGRVDERMVTSFMSEAQGDEAAQVFFADAPPFPGPAPVRSAPAELARLPAGPAIADEIGQLVPDAGRGVVYAIPRGGKAAYYIVNGDQKVTCVETSGAIHAATFAAGGLYLSVAGPARIVHVDGPTGKEEESWALPGGPPSSLAVLARGRLAAFPGEGGMLQSFDLAAGKVEATHYACTAVASDPRQRSIYACDRPPMRRGAHGHILVNGHPIFFEEVENDWQQTVLFRFVPAGPRLLLAAVRLNAASNGHVLHVSPDGRFVTVIGGGGWRPRKAGGLAAGYGVALFPAEGFGPVRGFYPVAPYPIGAAVNPVTGQVAVLCEQSASVHAMGGNPGAGVEVEGPFSGASAWSGDGRILYAAGKRGLVAFQNTLTAEEAARSVAWIDELRSAQPDPGPAAGASPEAKPVAATVSAATGPGEAEPLADLATFQISRERADVIEAIGRAAREGRTTKAPDWTTHPAYRDDADLARFLDDIRGRIAQKEEPGVLIYQLRKRRKTAPSHPGLALLLGSLFLKTNRAETGEPLFFAAVKEDRGQTTLAGEAMLCLAQARDAQGDALGAAWCAAAMLRLDLADPRFTSAAAELFRKAGLEAEAKAVLEKGAQPSAVPEVAARLPSLPPPPKPAGAPPGAPELFRRAAPSVVLVRTPDGSGSGICIGAPGWVVTNAHVVGDARASVEVVAYEWRGERLAALAPLRAEVVYRSTADDVAMLRVEAPPGSLVPTPVADRAPRAGEKVYAIGSPGLGSQVLEQSLSEGLIAAPERRIAGASFLQHTAAVNPGNSGGPLLDESGCVLGLVTLKADLEGVGFAIPALRLRAVLEAATGAR